MADVHTTIGGGVGTCPQTGLNCGLKDDNPDNNLPQKTRPGQLGQPLAKIYRQEVDTEIERAETRAPQHHHGGTRRQ